MKELKKLFSPIKIGKMEVKNRIVYPAMVTNFPAEDGNPSDLMIAYLEERAKGGAGLIYPESTCVDRGGHGFPRGAAIWDDSLIPGWRRLVDALHRHGTKVMCQLFHAGRQTYSMLIGRQQVAPSPIPCPLIHELPREITVEEIEEIIEKYAQAARRCQEAGFDGIEFHGGHGYLVAEFMSSYSNKRSDEYGGTLDGRMKFPLDCIRLIRREVGRDYPMTFRFSIEEKVPGGRTLEESKLIAPMVVEAGVDAIHITRGCYGDLRGVVPVMGSPPGIYVPYSAALKEVVDVPVIAVGRINDPLLAEQVLEQGKADLISMGRALVADPELPKKAAAGAFDEIISCPGDTQGCIEPEGIFNPTTFVMRCLVNPFVGREHEWKITSAKKPKKVLVAGGGPAGLEAARIAARRGHKVTLYEKSQKLGGQLNLAAVQPLFQELATVAKNLATQVRKLGVKVELGKEANLKVIEVLKPDVVIVATGAVPATPDLPGVNKPKVVNAHDVLAGKVAVGNKVLILGGGAVGCGVADLLGEHLKQVTIVEMLDDIGIDVGLLPRMSLMERLAGHGVKKLVKTTAKEITDDGAKVVRDGVEETIRGMDNIILAVGARPVNELAEKIKGKVPEVYVIGDAKKPRKAFHAIAEGAEVALKI